MRKLLSGAAAFLAAGVLCGVPVVHGQTPSHGANPIPPRGVAGSHALPRSTSSVPAWQWGWGNPTPSGDHLRAIAFGNGVYVAVGDGGEIYESSDAQHWSAENSGLAAGDGLYDVIFGNGKFIAGGSVGGTNPDSDTFLLSSTDGIHWTQVNQSTTAADHLGFGNGTYVAMNVDALTSTDGTHWISSAIGSLTAGDGVNFAAPVFGAGAFVAWGTDATGASRVYASTDNGSTWQSVSIAFSAGDTITGIAWNGSVFVALGSTNNCSPGCLDVHTSSDGINWTDQPDAGGELGMASSIGVMGSTFYVVSSDSTGSTDLLYTSTDGIHWTAGASVAAPFPYVGYGHTLIEVGSDFVGVDGNALNTVTSSDFTAWSATSLIQGDTGILWAATHGDSGFVAVGHEIMRSDDGKSWTTAMNLGSNDYLYDVTSNGSTYVAVGTKTYWSSDAKTWHLAASGPAYVAGTEAPLGVAYGNGVFVAVGSDGAYTSSDGSHWTQRVPNTVFLTSVAFTGQHFVAVAAAFVAPGGSILISSDGIDWASQKTITEPGDTALPGGTTLGFNHVRWTGSELFAVGEMEPGNSFIVASSKDEGLDWTVIPFGSSIGNSPFAAGGIGQDIVSLDGVLYTSPGFGLYSSTTHGASWTNVETFPGSAQVRALAANGTVLLSVGSFGDIAYGLAQLAPTADSGTLDVTGSTPTPGTLTGAPAASGDALSYAIASQPAHGTLKLTDAATGAYTYTAKSGFTGSDPFKFTVTDTANGLSSSAATITVKVSAAAGSGSGGGGGGFGLLLIFGLMGFVAKRRS